MIKMMPGHKKAGVLLTALGEEASADILKYLSANDVRRMGVKVSKFANPETDEVDAVLKEFCRILSAPGAGAQDFLLKVLTKALGEEKEAADTGGLSPELEALKWMEPQAILNIIRNEHPQAIAVILSQINQDQAVGILGELPEATRNDVILRMATLGNIPPGVVQEISEVLQAEFTKMGEAGETPAVQSATKNSEGPKQVAGILSQLTPSVEEKAMAALKDAVPELAQEIRELMFIFDDIEKIDDRGIQSLLKDVNKDDLALAIRGAKDGLKEKIYKNMSQRAAEMMKEDIEAKGPVKRSDVEKAQQAVVKLTVKLIDAGTIILGGGGEEGATDAMV
jgi:flagellar motor switch protein FliG